MTYAMTLDNSWELMTEDEMYDVNGGWFNWKEALAAGIIATITGAVLTFRFETAFAAAMGSTAVHSVGFIVRGALYALISTVSLMVIKDALMWIINVIWP